MFGSYDLEQFAQKGSKEEDITWANVAPDEKTWSITFNGLKFKDGAPVATKSEKIMMELGRLGYCHFINLNQGVDSFKLKFSAEVKQMEDSLRQVA